MRNNMQIPIKIQKVSHKSINHPHHDHVFEDSLISHLILPHYTTLLINPQPLSSPLSDQNSIGFYPIMAWQQGQQLCQVIYKKWHQQPMSP